MEAHAKPQDIPLLRFPRFRAMPGWETATVGQLFRERTDKGFPDKTVLAASQDKGIIPYDMLDKVVIRDKRNLIGYKLVKRGDFVISLRSFEGGFEYSQYEGIISPAYVVLDRTRDIDDMFFRMLFKSAGFISALRRTLNNSLRDGKSISYNQAKGIVLRVPSVLEQAAIAGCLSAVDDVIAAQTEKLRALEDHKSGLMQQLLPSLRGRDA